MNARYLVDARWRARLTQTEAARKAGMVPEALSRLESGRINNPTIGTLQRLASVYGCTVNDFLVTDEAPSNG